MLEAVKDLNKKRDKKIDLLFVAFTDLTSGKMSHDEFDGACYNWAYHYALDDMCYRPLPFMPYNVRDFYNLPDSKRRKIMEGDDARAKNTVLEFRREEMKAINTNKGNKQWLEKMVKYFEKKGDIEKRDKVKEVISKWSVQNL